MATAARPNRSGSRDRRGLSARQPGRSENQYEPPPLPRTSRSKDNREGVGEYRRTQGLHRPPPTRRTLEKRELRRRGAMPDGPCGFAHRCQTDAAAAKASIPITELDRD